MPLLRFLTEHRRVDKIEGVSFRCKLVDAVADGGQLPQDFIKLWVWLFTEPIAFDHRTEQGFFGIFEVFVDTIVICTLTALVILCSEVPVNYGSAAGAELTISGFTSTYGGWISIFTAVAMCCFAFSTIIGWGLYGTRCIEFLFGSKANKPFMVLYSLVAVVGATMDLGLMWGIAETFNGLMAIPNLIAVFLLSGVVVKLVKEYFAGEGAVTK